MVDGCLEVALSKRGHVKEQPFLLKQMIEGGLDARIVKVDCLLGMLKGHEASCNQIWKCSTMFHLCRDVQCTETMSVMFFCFRFAVNKWWIAWQGSCFCFETLSDISPQVIIPLRYVFEDGEAPTLIAFWMKILEENLLLEAQSHSVCTTQNILKLNLG